MKNIEFPREFAFRLAKLKHKKIVIKFGGSALNGNADMASFCEDIALLVSLGIRPIIIHGGGPEINEELKKLGKEVKKVAGLRITDDETLEVVMRVLKNINEKIVLSLKKAGIKAVGMEGAEGKMIVCRRMSPVPVKDENGNSYLVDLGNVGEVSCVDPTPINLLCASGFVPVIYPICTDENGKRVNVNADTVAAHIARALRSEEIFLVTDVPGIMKENGNGATVIPRVSLKEIDHLIANGVVKDGMVPKLEACRIAIMNGVKTAHMVCGKTPHSILNELLGIKDCGTKVVP